MPTDASAGPMVPVMELTPTVTMPTLLLGASGFDRPDTRESERLLDHFVARGGVALDTANFYHAGNHELLLGRWMAARRNRSQMVIVTKAAHPVDGIARVTPAAINADVEVSLRRLRTDNVDLLLLHRDDPAMPVEPLLACLEKLLQEGKVRAYGASNWSTTRLNDAGRASEALGVHGFSCSSPYLGLAMHVEPRWPDSVSACDDESLAWYAARQMPVLAWSSQSEGYFAWSDEASDVPGAYDHPGNQARRVRAQELGARRGWPASQVALAWVLSQPFPVAAIVGASSTDSVDRSVAGARNRLTDVERRWLWDGTGPAPQSTAQSSSGMT
jgi:aryl-alcohol dehydrogenase-like predicted oxidoreductase